MTRLANSPSASLDLFRHSETVIMIFDSPDVGKHHHEELGASVADLVTIIEEQVTSDIAH